LNFVTSQATPKLCTHGDSPRLPKPIFQIAEHLQKEQVPCNWHAVTGDEEDFSDDSAAGNHLLEILIYS
jgi:hypothetical protein